MTHHSNELTTITACRPLETGGEIVPESGGAIISEQGGGFIGIGSHSVTDSVSGQRCEVGVGTEPDFRRLGLGRVVASMTTAECVRRGLHGVEWHSHESNKGSIAIGRSIGLSELDQHVAYSCRLPAENVGDLDTDHCRELASHFERASGQINWSRFHAAGARALAGDREGALENVRLLIESDWEGEAEWLEEFWALQTLADDPEGNHPAKAAVLMISAHLP